MLDSNLKAEEETALQSHLETCMECRFMYEAFCGIEDTISKGMEEPPEDLFENIMAEIRREEIKKKNRRLRPILTAAACFAVVLLGALGLKNTLFSAKAAAPMMEAQAAVSGDMAAAEALPEEAPAPAPTAAAGQNSVFFAAASTQAFAAETEEPATAAGSDCKSEAGEGEYITFADTETMEALLALLSGRKTEDGTDCTLLYTVCCEEDGSSLQIFERNDGTIIYLSHLNDWYISECAKRDCENFFAASAG